MLVKCRKCGKAFDPSTTSAACSVYGHTPMKETEQSLSERSLQPVKKTKRPAEFQSDFKLVWGNSESGGPR